jgi:DNA-binding MarR family transcriptional regulator
MDPLHHEGSAWSDPDATPRWTFLTNHFLVLTCVTGRPDLRVRDIAGMVGITERATQAILSDLAHEGYVERIRVGRRNRYTVRRNAHFRHPLVSATSVGEVLDLVLSNGRSSAVG